MGDRLPAAVRWQQRDKRHDKQKRAERLKTLRNRDSEAAEAGDETARQRQDSERDRMKKSVQVFENVSQRLQQEEMRRRC